MRMVVRLLYPSSDFQWRKAADSPWDDRFSDLEMEHLLHAMSGDDQEIFINCRQVLDESLQSQEDIVYRQDILKDFLARPQLARQIYQICLDAEEKRRSSWYSLTSPHLSVIYSSAANLLKIYMEALVQIRRLTEEQTFSSEGLRRFSALLKEELSEGYLDQLRGLEYSIQEDDSVLISAGFGSYLQGVSYVKRQQGRGLSRLQWLLLPSYTVAERDNSGADDLGVRRDRAINQVANAMAQAADNLRNFTNALRKELSFYIGALNLHDTFSRIQTPVCFPTFTQENDRLWKNLYDGGLALLTENLPIGNTLHIAGKSHCLITGANQGGKTTFLRSVGQCQLMAQCGLFVCAEECCIPVRSTIYTHFKREEDAGMDSGKLDEELTRMSSIIDGFKPNGLLLSNESFSSTNDLDGSEILSQITQALLERKAEVFTVTHLVNYAMSFAENPNTQCLRAERKENGERTFRLIPGKPLKTAFGEDIYQKIFHP